MPPDVDTARILERVASELREVDDLGADPSDAIAAIHDATQPPIVEHPWVRFGKGGPMSYVCDRCSHTWTPQLPMPMNAFCAQARAFCLFHGFCTEAATPAPEVPHVG